MACCLAAPKYYLNQCWPVINGILWHLHEHGDGLIKLICHMCSWITLSKLLPSLRWRHNERDCVWNHQPYTIVYSTVYSDADQRKHQSSASLAFVWGIHRGPVNSPHKGPVTRKMCPFDDVIMYLPGANELRLPGTCQPAYTPNEVADDACQAVGSNSMYNTNK